MALDRCSTPLNPSPPIPQTTRVDAKYMSMAFSSWDTQKNGYITPAQVPTRCQASDLRPGRSRDASPTLNALASAPQMKHVMEANGSLPAGISQSDVREMLEFADANGDGKIQYNECVPSPARFVRGLTGHVLTVFASPFPSQVCEAAHAVDG